MIMLSALVMHDPFGINTISHLTLHGSYTLSKFWFTTLIYFCRTDQPLVHTMSTVSLPYLLITNSTERKGSIRTSTFSMTTVFFHYSFDIFLHQSTSFTPGVNLDSVFVLLIMQSCRTQNAACILKPQR